MTRTVVIAVCACALAVGLAAPAGASAPASGAATVTAKAAVQAPPRFRAAYRHWRTRLRHHHVYVGRDLLERPTRQAVAPVRSGLKGFFFHGIGKPGITEFRNTIVPAHRTHLQQKDPSNCLSRRYLTDGGGQVWLGSAMVYEFESRAALDDFFRDEPYCTNGIYQKIDIYDWQRGRMA